MQSVSLEQNIVLADHVSDCVDTICVHAEHLALDVQEYFPRLLSALKYYVVFVKPHWLEFLQVVEVKCIGAIFQKRHSLDCISIKESGQLDLERGWQHVKQVAHVLLRGTRHAHVLFEIYEKPIDQVRSYVEFFVKFVRLSDPFLIDLARVGKLTEKRRQFAQEGHEDAHSEDDNHKDPAQLEAT